VVARTPATLTPEEYLVIERQTETRSEYVSGYLRSIHGSTLSHARIAGNTLAELLKQVCGTNWEVLGQAIRVHVPSRQFYGYPDVVCTRRSFPNDPDDFLADATLIIEVLSPSTKNYDRGEKFEYYRSLPSFAEYLLVHQDRICAEHYAKQPDNTWIYREHTRPDETIQLQSINCSLTLDSVYERVVFTPDRS
jgi:Uma2 family endonuclease